ncbi:uncharacterized protein LOC124460859 [Drosophila willistoni]|uniref:uncharacterized protein LOC124460859 n=1 Tax=Drosophila willistoni TaxID=7260 RepID=UPI001F07AC97|nr:uncharacterized protein LOC124460859 [Drosophila willistoni]
MANINISKSTFHFNCYFGPERQPERPTTTKPKKRKNRKKPSIRRKLRAAGAAKREEEKRAADKKKKEKRAVEAPAKCVKPQGTSAAEEAPSGSRQPPATNVNL